MTDKPVLTAGQVAVLVLYADGNSYREVGDLLGITESAAKSRCARAAERLGTHHVTRTYAVALSRGLLEERPRRTPMGYTTDFTGRVTVTPPLNPHEIAYLTKFGTTRRMRRGNGPYFVDGTGYAGQGRDADIEDFNQQPADQPGLWCGWVPTESGDGIEWNGVEKFYRSAE